MNDYAKVSIIVILTLLVASGALYATRALADHANSRNQEQYSKGCDLRPAPGQDRNTWLGGVQ